MELGPKQQQYVTALRSGKYQQSIGKTRDNEKLCAIGVGMDEFKLVQAYSFQNKVKMHSEGLVELIRLNDLRRLPFTTIADKIESNPEKFFYKGV